jgi:hypothetical protein
MVPVFISAGRHDLHEHAMHLERQASSARVAPRPINCSVWLKGQSAIPAEAVAVRHVTTQVTGLRLLWQTNTPSRREVR